MWFCFEHQSTMLHPVSHARDVTGRAKAWRSLLLLCSAKDSQAVVHAYFKFHLLHPFTTKPPSHHNSLLDLRQKKKRLPTGCLYVGSYWLFQKPVTGIPNINNLRISMKKMANFKCWIKRTAAYLLEVWIGLHVCTIRNS